jgi:uncharacterized damage-inducible protein DinB/predicted RNase H-like HicB family nuclease
MRYPAHIEGRGSHWMGHILALPGCCVRGGSRAEVLRSLPGAVREHRDWLDRHGQGSGREAIEVSIHVAEEIVGTGPFNPGDACALFSIERSPVTLDQIEDCLRLMSCSRSDLLELVGNLPDQVLDWRESRTEFSVRIVLRHVGNAEEWYISRLFEPDQLPREWAADHTLPVFEFLDLERRGCLDCLRRLDERQRSEVFRPAHFTDHPEEEWTARKVLRRYVEHEREHTRQARAILAACPAWTLRQRGAG